MNYIKKIDIKLVGIIIIAILSRAVLLGVYPVGIHVDEAYAAYEAYSMLMYGTDSWGYVNPVYLTVWGSGMSALESYMMMPFIAIWGLSLYCYALVWIFVPVFLILSIIYCLKHKKIRVSKYSASAVIVLGIVALPLMLFVLINMGIL